MFNYERLEELMQMNHINQTQLAEVMGVSSYWFQHVKSGADTGFNKVCMVADYFGVPTDYFRGKGGLPEKTQKQKKLEEYMLHTKLATEVVLVKKIAKDNNLSISEIKKNTPGYDDMRKLGYDIWKDDDKSNVTDL